MPLPTTRVIPPGWSAHHATVTGGACNATVTVRFPDGEPTYDPATDDTVQPYTTVWAGPALINETSADRLEQAADSLTGTAYTVQLAEAVTGIRPGHEVRVDTAPNDGDLATRTLYVIGPVLGSETFSRVVRCSTSSDDTP